MADDISRGEFDLLKGVVSRLENRVDSIDSNGTRGVAVLGTQIADLTKDVVRMEVEVAKRFDAHDDVHRRDADSRRSGRRWVIGTAIAALAALGAILTVVVEILAHVH